jgi:hypothetical protein
MREIRENRKEYKYMCKYGSDLSAAFAFRDSRHVDVFELADDSNATS